MTTPTADLFEHLSEEKMNELRAMRTEAIDAVFNADLLQDQADKARREANKLLRKYERRLEKYTGTLTLFDPEA